MTGIAEEIESASFVKRVKLGALAGLIMAGFFTGLALLILLARGGLSAFPAAVGTYVAAGLIGGALYGALAPWSRGIFGAAVVGAVVGTAVYGSVALTLFGTGQPWQTLAIESAAPGVLVGAGVAVYWRWRARRAAPRTGRRPAT